MGKTRAMDGLIVKEGPPSPDQTLIEILALFDDWVEETGHFVRRTSPYHEMQAILEHAYMVGRLNPKP